MQSTVSAHHDRFPLARAVDALGAAVRQTARPSFVWIAGLLYPSVTLGLDPAWDGLLSRSPTQTLFQWLRTAMHGAANVEGNTIEATFDPWAAVSWMPCLGILLIPLYRLVVGLARVAPEAAWDEARGERHSPTLGAVWRAGRGLTLSAFVLWFQLAMTMLVATVVLALPSIFAMRFLVMEPIDPLQGSAQWARFVLAAPLVGPFVFLLVAYTLAISVLCQLGLHSLAHNRRGVSSALLHGWRIMRADPRATGRAVLVDVLLFFVVQVLWRAAESVVSHVPGGTDVMWALHFVLLGFLGAARACYWAAAYRSLGGLSPDDGVPGLVEGNAVARTT